MTLSKFEKLVRRFEKQLETARRYMPHKGLTDSWWIRYGNSLWFMLNELQTTYSEEFTVYKEEHGWYAGDLNVMDFMS